MAGIYCLGRQSYLIKITKGLICMRHIWCGFQNARSSFNIAGKKSQWHFSPKCFSLNSKKTFISVKELHRIRKSEKIDVSKLFCFSIPKFGLAIFIVEQFLKLHYFVLLHFFLDINHQNYYFNFHVHVSFHSLVGHTLVYH